MSSACFFLKKCVAASWGSLLQRLAHSNQTSSTNFRQSHWYSCQYICSINHKHCRDSIGLYLEIQTPAHKSHLCKCFTRAQCVFYVFYLTEILEVINSLVYSSICSLQVILHPLRPRRSQAQGRVWVVVIWIRVR